MVESITDMLSEKLKNFKFIMNNVTAMQYNILCIPAKFPIF